MTEHKQLGKPRHEIKLKIHAQRVDEGFYYSGDVLDAIKGVIKEIKELHDFELKNKNYDRANTCAICMNIVKKWLVVEEEE